MNIVYLLTNTNKKEGEKRFYIGSKTECRIEKLHNRDVIIDIKTEKPYWGSACSFEMKNDLKIHKFSASILEIVGNKLDLLKIENSYILKYNAVDNIEYYNLSEAKVNGNKINKNLILNIFGETYDEFANSASTISKKQNTAKKLGFKNIYGLCIYIKNEYEKLGKYSEIAKNLKHKNRHFPSVYTINYNLDKMEKECFPYNIELKNKMIYMFMEKASVKCIAKHLNVEIPTVIFYINDYINSDKKFIVAVRKGLTQEELEIQVLKLVLDGMTIPQASEKLKLNTTSGYRYFYRGIRKRLKSNDF